jgi:beta-lactamase superfamily II metal-dependent hydrolase
MESIMFLSLALTAAVAVPAADPGRLSMHFVDVEGGAATLIVTPAHETILIDCGNPGGRDAGRIHDAMTRLGLKTIDHLVLTHWHTDHYGGVGRLAQLVPIARFYHHGIPETLKEDPTNFPLLIGALRTAAEGKTMVRLRPGDLLPLKQAEMGPKLTMRCLASDGEVVPADPNAPANPAAADNQPMPPDTSDNAKSLGFLLEYGAFRYLNLGDLTWNIEYQLVHPSDRIGPVDVYQVSHHGLAVSSNTALVRTVQPRVAVFNNGPRKGAAPRVLADLRRLPEPPTIYQMHRNLTVGAQENTDPEYIANPDEKCAAAGIDLEVAADGQSYALTVGPKGKPKRYECRGR